MLDQKKYYTIREVSEQFGVASSLIRYWEKMFKELRPQKQHGVRKYTSDDIERFRKVFELVKERGYTLRGAQQVLQLFKNENVQKKTIINHLNEVKSFLENLI